METPDIQQPLDFHNEAQLAKERQIIRKFELRPLRFFEELLTINGEFDGPWWVWVKRMWAKTRDISHLVLDELDFAYKHLSNTIIVIFGTWGTGKSILALSIAKHLQNRIKAIHGIKAPIDISFSMAETFREIHKMQRGGIRIQDEDPRLSGEGTRTVKDALYNVQSNALRANLNCFLIDSKEPPSPHSANLVLQPFGIDYQHQLTRVKVFSAYTLRPLGWAVIPKLDDPLLEHQYQELKDRHVKRIIETKGLASVQYSLERLKREAKKLLDATKNEFGDIDLQKNYLELMLPFAGILGNTQYQKNVAKYAWIQVIKDQEGTGTGARTTYVQPAVSLSHIDFQQGLVPAFIDAMKQFIAIHLPSTLPRSPKRAEIAHDCALIYPYYLDQLSAGDIWAVLRLKSEMTVSRRIIALNQFFSREHGAITEKVGKLYEDVFCSYYRQQGHQVVQGGGSLPGGIDALVDGQVWSLKCYHDAKNKTLKVYFDDISKDEKAYAHEHNPRLGISLLNPFWGVESRIELDIADFERQGEVSFRTPK